MRNCEKTLQNKALEALNDFAKILLKNDSYLFLGYAL